MLAEALPSCCLSYQPSLESSELSLSEEMLSFVRGDLAALW